MKISILSPNLDIKPLESLLIQNGKLWPIPYEKFNEFSQEQVSCFCLRYGVYQVPTSELIDFLASEILFKPKTLEIGAGNGSIGRILGIHMIDNKMQESNGIKELYDLMGQPPVQYGNDVEKIDGNTAIKKYLPSTVIGCWITSKWKEGMESGNMFGVDEKKMFRDGIRKYIHVGNETTHSHKKELLGKKVREIKAPWLISRSLEREKNVIYVFEK